MNDIAARWDAAADSNEVVRFIDTNLRGAGQVMFQNNPLTGLLFIIGITWGAVDADMADVAIGSVVALIVATVTAYLLNVDENSRRIGLYGFNGILVGAAVPTFLDVDGVLVWAVIIVGAAVSTVVMLAIANVFSTWGVPALTFPFVLTTWFLMLGAYAFEKIEIASLSTPALPVATTATAADIDVTAELIFETLFRNVAQVFLINNVATGVIFVIALAVSSRWSAVFSLVGSAVALAVALAVGASASDITAGLFGFSAVLTAIALGSVFYSPGWRVLAYAVLGVVFTVIVQGAMDTFLAPVGIPTFTVPFVFVTWLFLLPHETLVPVPHEDIERGAVGATTAPDSTATSS